MTGSTAAGETCESCGGQNTQQVGLHQVRDLEAFSEEYRCLELECAHEWTVWR